MSIPTVLIGASDPDPSWKQAGSSGSSFDLDLESTLCWILRIHSSYKREPFREAFKENYVPPPSQFSFHVLPRVFWVGRLPSSSRQSLKCIEMSCLRDGPARSQRIAQNLYLSTQVFSTVRGTQAPCRWHTRNKCVFEPFASRGCGKSG